MGLKEIFKFKGWVPDKSRSHPKKEDWPDHIITLNYKKFDKFIEKYPISVVDFWAPWCEPCKKITPSLRQLSKEFKGKVAFGKVNVDQNSDLTKRFHVLGVPNVFLFSYGEKIKSFTGIRRLSDYKKEIENILMMFDK